MKGSCTFPSSWLKGLSLHEVPQDWEMLTSEPLKVSSELLPQADFLGNCGQTGR